MLNNAMLLQTRNPKTKQSQFYYIIPQGDAVRTRLRIVFYTVPLPFPCGIIEGHTHVRVFNLNVLLQ